MFSEFLFQLRGQGLKVGTAEWLGLLRAMDQGLISDVPSLYTLGRALLCRSETEFDSYDLAFAAAFKGAELPADLRQKLSDWLDQQREIQQGNRPPLDETRSAEELWKELAERLAKQTERHDGGNYWVGTKGTSPFGNNGEGKGGLRLGGEGGRGGAVQVAMERKWANYRTDRTLDVRDFEIALRALRNLRRDGRLELDLDGTIRSTADNGGEIDIVERPERKNQVHLVLLMDTGGSMTPHAERVERLFTAASRTKMFRSFKSYSFHNCVYDRLYTDYENLKRIPTSKVLDDLTPRHRVVFVGDASMAPYELFSSFGWPGEGNLAGIEWLKRIHERCPVSVWLNPDAPRFWNHPTVSAIGRLFPMHELTVDGLRTAVKRLRAPV